MDSLFNTELPLLVKLIVAFAVVLALLAAVMWVFRRLGGERLGGGSGGAPRGRQPRLAVIDAAAIDSRRRLVLLRRDNVEHLVMIGGPSDVLIEQNIVRAVPVQPAREAPPRSAEPPPQRIPVEALRTPPAEPPPRRPERPERQELPPPRAPRSEPPPRRQAAADFERPRGEPSSFSGRGPAPEPPRQSRAPLPPSRLEPEPYPGDVPPAPPLVSEPNLSNMAHKLEAALRRPGLRGSDAIDSPPPLSEPTPPTAPDLSGNGPRLPVREPSSGRLGPPPDVPGPRPSSEPMPGGGKSMFDSLEEEMASLLGRPSDPNEKK